MTTTPKLKLSDRLTLERAAKFRAKRERRGRVPLLKVYSAREVELLLAHGWQVHTFTPVSYGAPRTWLLEPVSTSRALAS